MSVLPSVIDAVTVFRRGALVRRRVKLVDDATAVRVGPLSLAIEDDSLRIIGGEGAVAREARVVLSLAEADARLAPPRDEVFEAARDAEAVASAQLDAHRATTSAIAALHIEPRARPREAAPGPIPTAARVALLAFRHDALQRRAEEERSLQNALRLLAEERAELEEQLRQASSARNPRANQLRKAVDIALDEASAGGELQIEYFVPGARWAPTYALRLHADMERGRLVMRAWVAQQSGEDWSDVVLRLSTAEPSSWTELPELNAIRIGRRQPPAPSKDWRPPPPGTGALFADFDAAFGVPPNAPPQRPPPVSPAQAAPPPHAAPPAAPRMDRGAGSEPQGEASTMVFGGVADGAAASVAAIGEPPAAAAPAKKRMMPMRSMAMAGGASDDSARMSDLVMSAADVGTSEPALAVGEELLRYRRLRMAGPDEPGRGRLRPVSAGDSFEGLPGDPAASERNAIERAERIGGLPDGCSPPVEIEGFDYAFETADRVSVPSTGRWLSVPVHETTVEGRRHYVVVPREQSDAFRYLDVPGPFVSPLLRGPLDVYVDGRFLLAREMPQVAPSDALRLGLGVESRIAVARNARFEESSAGLMRGSLDLSHSIEVELQSQLDLPAQVEVRERIPVAAPNTGDDVEVSEGQVRPPWETWEPGSPRETGDGLEGGRRWRVDLEPRGKATLRAAYVVRIAAKNELLGGNRRER